MSGTPRARLAAVAAAGCLCLAVSQPASAQEFPTGAAAAAWQNWQAAMEAVLAGEGEAAEAAFTEMLAEGPSPLRLALLAERTVMRSALGGALLRLEQDYESGKLTGSAQQVADMLISVGREQMNQADDGWYFLSIGRFDVANANFRALLDSDPDPVALLEFADQKKKRRELLLQVVNSPIVGDSAREIIKLLDRGDTLIKADPIRIKEHIGRLNGPPRAFENAVSHLKESGEYAIPFLVQALRDPDQKHLTQAILRTLPQIDRPALNPLVVALEMDDHATKRYLINALGQIGYTQAVPYLLKLRENPETPVEVLNAVDEALSEIGRRATGIEPGGNAAESFFRLAEAYYNNHRTVAADPRLDMANVWYWRDGLLQNVEVPTDIFDEVMSMRTCWQALQLDEDLRPALALWLAANFRREAQLPMGQSDRTVPEGFPTAAYFAQSAGAEYCALALARALNDGDVSVALGTIEALRKTGGPASVVGDAAGRQPLADALTFPDRMVRIRAALALARALPTQTFENYQNLMPVLAEAMMLFGGSRNALVVDPDEATANSVIAALRADGYNVVSDADLGVGLDKVQNETPGVDVIVIASDVQPALREALARLRRNVVFRSLPVVVVNKPADRIVVRDALRGDHRAASVLPDVTQDELRATIETVARAVGAQQITADLGLMLAMETSEVLGLIAETNNPVFDVADVEPQLIAALRSTSPELRVSVASVLGHLNSGGAQEAIASIALNAAEEESTRIAMFEALAQAAKRRGNLLSDATVAKVIEAAAGEPNMRIREAASQALGALNLPAHPGGDIVRNQYPG